jgi:hypothetical protein
MNDPRSRLADALADRYRIAAKRTGASIHEIDSSHVPMLSKPRYVLDVIRTAAYAVLAGSTVA